MNELSIIITLPAKINWEDYLNEIFAAARGAVMNFKVSQFPQNVKVGDKCYICHRGYIKGWMTITGFLEKEFQCTTTGKYYTGKFIERSGKFHYLKEQIPYKGFQGFRYFSLDAYKKELGLCCEEAQSLFPEEDEEVQSYTVKSTEIPEEYKHCSYCKFYETLHQYMYCTKLQKQITAARKNICKYFQLDK